MNAMEQLKADVIRHGALEGELEKLYKRRADKEKHISRIIPEYSEDWDNDPGVKHLSKKHEEKRISGEMMLLGEERREILISEEKYLREVERRLGEMDADEAVQELTMQLAEVKENSARLDKAAQCGVRLIRQTGMIKRSVDQAIKFRGGNSGLSEPLKMALHLIDNRMMPDLKEFYSLMGEPPITQNLRKKVTYCQVRGSDWVWEGFDLDIIGFITRLFHKPDQKRFEQVDVELLNIRYEVYGMMRRICKERTRLIEALISCGEKCGL
jgi:hypothetical protein